ncbi:MAG: sigma-54 dependent transcriptional regulator [Vicinamibacteria bacterium]|nr:sigma-54 dependent transcriptional regulator [Vicinamibacteria bacterium]
MARPRLLVVDDDEAIRFTLREYLDGLGYDLDEAAGCGEALQRLAAGRFDAIVLDYAMPDGNSVDLLPRLRQVDADVPVVILTGHGTIELAVRAIQAGADQFLTKPIELQALGLVVERLVDKRRAGRRERAGQRREQREAPDPFLGRSRAIRQLADEARRVVASDSPVLIEGETGTGKGVLAAWLHANGPRAAEAFVDLNCAGLSRELLESELFGHERGAFTTAVAAKPGLLEIAHRGSVFLDELAEMDLAVQARLLKVVEEQRFRRVGDVRDRQVDVRLIAATHRDLRAMASRQAFRSDLYFRLSTLPLRVPPLRERAEDVPLLAERLLVRIGRDMGRGDLELAAAAVDLLQGWSWPGNVRELRNVLERAALLCDGDRIEARHLRLDAAAPAAAPEVALAGTLAEIERRAVEAALRESGGNVVRTATRLGISRSTLYAKLKAWGLEPRGEAG